MVYRAVMEHHLSRFYNISHLVKELVVDTERDPKAEDAIEAVIAEWVEWCSTTEHLFPSMTAASQVQRVFEQGSKIDRDGMNTARVRSMFEQTNELIRRLKVIHQVIDEADEVPV